MRQDGIEIGTETKKLYSMILLAGGIGTRMHNSIPKQFMLLAGKPVIMHTLEKVDCIQEIDYVVIVCAKEYRNFIELMCKQYNISKPIVFADSGATRQESVRNGLALVDTRFVIVHEAARPFAKIDEFRRYIEASDENIILGSPIYYTVVKGNEKVDALLERSELVNVQLPQKFNTEILKAAHKEAEHDGKVFTEDASLIFFYHPDVEIKIYRGTDYNIKLTTPMDMLIGELIYKEYFI